METRSRTNIYLRNEILTVGTFMSTPSALTHKILYGPADAEIIETSSPVEDAMTSLDHATASVRRQKELEQTRRSKRDDGSEKISGVLE